jgi:hypothetical protein
MTTVLGPLRISKYQRGPNWGKRERKARWLRDFANNPVHELTGRENFQLMKIGCKNTAALHAAARGIIKERVP